MTVWPDGDLRSPVTGAALHPAEDCLRAGDERWPIIDGIPFLRADRRALADEVLACIDSGHRAMALALLLADQDGYAPAPPPNVDALIDVVTDLPRLSFRQAMDGLGYGPVADYFAHRWSDPTFLSGLALAEAHWHGTRVFELACGAGHFLRAFLEADADVAGGDLVFSKLWLARHFVAPHARLVCFDAAVPWPLPPDSADTVFCHDAFYFLPSKPRVASAMRRIAGPHGTLLVGHAHNAAVANHSAGQPLAIEDYVHLFASHGADPLAYDDRELTRAYVEQRTPTPAQPSTLAHAPAVSFAAGLGPVRPAGQLGMPRRGDRVVRNPLYANGRITWPSPRYQSEYASLATYPAQTHAPETATAGPDTEALIRNRVLLDLPPRW